MIYRLLALLVVFCACCSSACAAEGSLFSAQERQWIADHPVLHIGIDLNNAPLEFFENGEYQGLAADHLNYIKKITGLKLKFVRYSMDGGVLEAGEQVDIFPLVESTSHAEQLHDLLIYTTPYYRGSTAVITRRNEPVVRNWEDLEGKTVALRSLGIYRSFIQKNFPKIRIITINNLEEALRAVADRRADAALGLDVIMFGYVRRSFADKLSFAGRIGNYSVDLGMGVRKDLPILASIVEKSLKTMSAEKNDKYILRWEEGIGHRRLSVAALLSEYALQISSFLLGFILLVIFFIRERRARRRAIRSEYEKSMFLAVMSHEIRSPMNAIISSIELLQHNTLDPELKKILTVASTASEVLLALLNNVLDFSKLKAKRLDLIPLACDVSVLLRTIVDMMLLKSQEKQIPITLSLDVAENLWIMVDANRLRQILINLLSNAVKYTERGSITVIARMKIEAAGTGHSEFVISVTDTGIGISPQAQKHLFQPFFQAGASAADRHGGSGLGLMICRELVTLMGGRLQLVSQLGQGTTVSFTIPCQMMYGKDEGNVVEALRKQPKQGVQKNLRAPSIVLVVEDQAANRFTIERQLQILGCTALMADSGRSALRIFQQEQIDLVLMDCYMPGMDGYTTAKAMRENAKSDVKRIPIIAISAATDLAHQEKCLDSGMDGILTKPLRLNDLKKLLNVWLDRSVAGPTVEVPLTPQALYGLFTQSTRSDATQMRQACTARDIQLMLHLSHRIKGSAPMFGAQEAMELADSIESTLKADPDPDWSTIEDAVEVLNEVIDELHKSMARAGDPSAANQRD